MENHIARGKKYEDKAETRLSNWGLFEGWGLFGDKYESAAEHLETATNAYKLAKDWEKAAELYDKLAMCYSKTKSDYEEANAKMQAGDCYSKLSSYKIAIERYKDAAEYFDDSGNWNSAAKCYNIIASVYLKDPEPHIRSVMEYFEKAAQRYDTGNMTSLASSCFLRIAKLAAEEADYKEAIRIYEKIASESLGNSLLKFGARKHLLFAGICRFCNGDTVDFIEGYLELVPPFSNSREYGLLASIAKAIEEPTEENVSHALGLYTEIESTTSDDTALGKSDEMSSRKPLLATLFPRLENKLVSGGGQENEEDLT